MYHFEERERLRENRRQILWHLLVDSELQTDTLNKCNLRGCYVHFEQVICVARRQAYSFDRVRFLNKMKRGEMFDVVRDG